MKKAITRSVRYTSTNGRISTSAILSAVAMLQGCAAVRAQLPEYDQAKAVAIEHDQRRPHPHAVHRTAATDVRYAHARQTYQLIHAPRATHIATVEIVGHASAHTAASLPSLKRQPWARTRTDVGMSVRNRPKSNIITSSCKYIGNLLSLKSHAKMRP